jgi:hypothetical protein
MCITNRRNRHASAHQGARREGSTRYRAFSTLCFASASHRFKGRIWPRPSQLARSSPCDVRGTSPAVLGPPTAPFVLPFLHILLRKHGGAAGGNLRKFASGQPRYLCSGSHSPGQPRVQVATVSHRGSVPRPGMVYGADMVRGLECGAHCIAR